MSFVHSECSVTHPFSSEMQSDEALRYEIVHDVFRDFILKKFQLGNYVQQRSFLDVLVFVIGIQQHGQQILNFTVEMFSDVAFVHIEHFIELFEEGEIYFFLRFVSYNSVGSYGYCWNLAQADFLGATDEIFQVEVHFGESFAFVEIVQFVEELSFLGLAQQVSYDFFEGEVFAIESVGEGGVVYDVFGTDELLRLELENGFVEVEGVLRDDTGRFNRDSGEEGFEEAFDVIDIDGFEQEQAEGDDLHVSAHSQKGSHEPFVELIAIVQGDVAALSVFLVVHYHLIVEDHD